MGTRINLFISSIARYAVAPLVLIAAVLFGAMPLRAAPPDGGLASPPIDVPGTLIIGGGGGLPDSVYRLFMGLPGDRYDLRLRKKK